MRPISFVTAALAAIAGMTTATAMDPPVEAALEARVAEENAPAAEATMSPGYDFDEAIKPLGLTEPTQTEEHDPLKDLWSRSDDKKDKTKGVLGNALHGVLNDDELKKVDGVLDVVADKIGHLISRDLEAADKIPVDPANLPVVLPPKIPLDFVLDANNDGSVNFEDWIHMYKEFKAGIYDREAYLSWLRAWREEVKGTPAAFPDWRKFFEFLPKHNTTQPTKRSLPAEDADASEELIANKSPNDADKSLSIKPYLDYNDDGSIDSRDLDWRIKNYINGKTDRDGFVAWLEEYQQRFQGARKDVPKLFMIMMDALRKINMTDSKPEPPLQGLDTTKPSKRSPAEDLRVLPVILPPKLDSDGDGDIDQLDLVHMTEQYANGTIDSKGFFEYLHAWNKNLKNPSPNTMPWLQKLRKMIIEHLSKSRTPVQESDTTKPSKRSLPVDVIADDRNAAKKPPVSIERLACDCKNVIASVLAPRPAEGMTHEWYAEWNKKYYPQLRWREVCFDTCVDEAMAKFVGKLKELRVHDSSLNLTKREEASNEPEPEAEQIENIVPTNVTKADKKTLLSFRDWFAETHRTGEYCTCAMKEKPNPRLWGWVPKLSPNSNKRCAKFCDDVVDKWLKHERCPQIIPGGLHGGRCVFPNDGPKNSTADMPADKPVDGKPT